MPLFETLDETKVAVWQDLTDLFLGIFEGAPEVTPVSSFAEERVGTLSSTSSVLAWEWPVVHVGHLQGTPPTGRSLTMRGVTVIERAATVTRRGDVVIGDEGKEDDYLFSRYIDWLALYAELGAVTITRPPVDDRTGIPENVNHPVDPNE